VLMVALTATLDVAVPARAGTAVEALRAAKKAAVIRPRVSLNNVFSPNVSGNNQVTTRFVSSSRREFKRKSNASQNIDYSFKCRLHFSRERALTRLAALLRAIECSIGYQNLRCYFIAGRQLGLYR
jgi:hypothetical protein